MVDKGGEGEAPLARWDNAVARSAVVTPLSLSTLLPSSTCHGEEKVSGTHGQENSGAERHTPNEVILEGSDATVHKTDEGRAHCPIPILA